MLKISNLHKSFGTHHVLKGVNLHVKKGEFIAIIGASGCGKTTLIRCINGFIVPEKGHVEFEDKKVEYHKAKKLRKLRKKVGMIYQLFNLVERTSTLHNVLCGTLGDMNTGLDFFKSMIGLFGKKRVCKAMEMLGFVGLADRASTRADKLSGGQKQRVAIARALMQDPHLLLADEPIANLDPKTSTNIIELLKTINQEKNLTIITVIHHIDFVKDHFSRVVAMKDGQIVFDGSPELLDQEKLDDIYGGEPREGEECEAA